MFQLTQKPLRLLQIRRVEPLGEPSVHRREQVASFLTLFLLLPQAGEAGGGAELQGACAFPNDVEWYALTRTPKPNMTVPAIKPA